MIERSYRRFALSQAIRRPEFAIGIGDLAVVRVITILRAKRFRRIIRAVRIVEVKPEEKRMLLVLLQPRERMIDALVRSSVDQSDIFLLESAGEEGIVVINRSRERAPNSIQNKGTDHRPRSVACLLECLCDRAKFGPRG